MPFGVWDSINVLIWWLVTQAYTYTKCQQDGHVIFGYCSEYKIYFITEELVQEKQSAYGEWGEWRLSVLFPTSLISNPSVNLRDFIFKSYSESIHLSPSPLLRS